MHKSSYLVILFSLFLSALIGQHQWTVKTPLPQNANGRHHPITFSYKNFGYVMAGSDESDNLDDAYKYDATTDSWTQIASFPGGPRGYAYGAMAGDKAYIGFGQDRESGQPTEFFNDLWEFDPETEDWKALAQCPCEPRSHPAFVTTDTKLFVGLGNNFMGNFKDWWEYDIASDTWSQKPDFIGARRHHPYFFSLEGLIYVAFGHGQDIYNDLHVYDPKTEEWKFLNFLPSQGRVAGTQFTYGGKGYILSGDDDTHSNLATGELWSYDPKTNEWEQHLSHPGQGRWAPGCFVIEDTLYFTGGEFIILYSDLVTYNLIPESTSTEDHTNASIEIFPNPSRGLFNIKGISQELMVHVFNTQGKRLFIKSTTDGSIDLSHLADGKYFIQFYNSEKLLFSENIVIQH